MDKLDFKIWAASEETGRCCKNKPSNYDNSLAVSSECGFS